MEGQDRLPFSRTRQSGILVYAHPRERQALAVLGILAIVFSTFYIYFMISSVVHVAARQELAQQASRASADVAALETTYLERTEGITESYAKSLGYVAVNDQVFVEKENVVSFRNTQ